MEDQVILKSTTFGGFEKRGVLGYIDEMNRRAKDAQDGLQKKLDDMSAAQGEFTQQVTAFSEKITTLEEQLRTERGKISELTGVINTLNSEITTQKQTAARLGSELLEANEKNRQLQFKTDSLEYKSRRFDESATKVGQVLIEARESADRILEVASQQADEIRMAAQQSVETISGELEGFKGDVAQLRQSIADVMNSIACKLDGLDSAIDQIEKRCATANEWEEVLEQSVQVAQNADEELDVPPFFRENAAK